MSLHYIGNFGFELWDGDPPHMVQQTVESFTRPGIAGVGQQLAGVRGEQFEVMLTSHLPTFNQAVLASSALYALPGVGLLDLVYNGIHYRTVFSHQYTVDRFDVIGIQTGVLIGTKYVSGQPVSYDYPFGGVLRGRFLLTPHRL
jgi:hypothetical protein